MAKLFDPIKLGRHELAHRIAMAPLTRFRADDDHVPAPFAAEYYAQRAAVPGSFTVTEATLISPRAGGYKNAPGIYSEAQIAAWKRVTDAVHAQNSHIFLQLWALGRAADPEVLKEEGGFDFVSSGDVPVAEGKAKPRPLQEDEIRSYVRDYAQAAHNAIEAGFDGVEVHAANGYLIDQFLQDTANNRTDSWGGSVENRSRFAVEVTNAVVEAVGADRTGIRLSPWSSFGGMRMADPIPQFTHVAQKLAEIGLAYAHLVEPRTSGDDDADPSPDEGLEFFFQTYGDASPVIVAGGYTPESAREAVEVKYRDHDVIVAFGRHFISTPDLPFRIKHGIELAPYNRDTFYTPGPAGYTDYPYSDQFQQAEAG